MRAIPSDKIEAGRLATAFATPDPAIGPPGNISFDHGAASAGDNRPEFGRSIDAAFARIERAIVRVLHGLRDARDRRQAARELRRLSPALLADIGIESEEVEQIIDAKFATRRNQPPMRSQRPQSRLRKSAARLAVGSGRNDFSSGPGTVEGSFGVMRAPRRFAATLRAGGE